MVDTFRMATKAIIESDGKVLIIKENEDYEEGTNADKWQIPGGRLEPGEKYGEALKREVREETGLEMEMVKPVTVGEWRPEIKGEKYQIVAVFFQCRTGSREVELSHEHTNYKWIDPREHESYNLIGNLHSVFEDYLDNK